MTGPEDTAADVPLADRLGEAALAAVMGDPYEVGLRIALDDGVAAALPMVARELAWLDAAVAATGAGIAALAPPADAARGVPVAASAPSAEPVMPGGPAGRPPAPAASRGRKPAAPDLADAGFAKVERAAERVVAQVPLAAPGAAPVAAPEMAAPAAPGRLDWDGAAWGGLAAVAAGLTPETKLDRTLAGN